MTDLNQRLLVVQLVSGKKDVLFSAYSNTLTRKDKEDAWESIRRDAVAGRYEGLANKNWQYVRDQVWGSARRDALKKWDIASRSGEGAVKFNRVSIVSDKHSTKSRLLPKVDNIVLDIIGKKSAVASGLEVEDTEQDEENLKKQDKEPGEGEPGEPEIKLIGTSSSTSRRSVFATPRYGFGGKVIIYKKILYKI